MRLRITFSKQGALRYTGHLDLHKMWERTARRANLPLAYSQGFHPQPKIQLASALPLGYSSRCEILDMRVNADLDLEELPLRLQNALPGGLRVLAVEAVEENLPTLQTQVTSAEYEVTLQDTFEPDELASRLSALLHAETLPRERRGKQYDLRPLLEALEIKEAGIIFMRLAAREGATGRPDEVLSEIGITPDSARVERTCLIFK